VDVARQPKYRAPFVQADVRQFSICAGSVDFIVMSPPCTEFSQIWRFARHRTPDPIAGLACVRACVRIATEAGVPWTMENVQGAVPIFAAEFGLPTWHVGPFYFWGERPVLFPQGTFRKGMWNTNRDKTGERLWNRDGRAATYVRDPALRAKVPIEIARCLAREMATRF
jgi:hypothetical protein